MPLKTILAIAVILILATGMILNMQSKNEDEIHLLPEGYIGLVVILFNQESGAEKEYEGESRLYRIPANGILKTQFEPNDGIAAVKYFIRNKTNPREELRYISGQEISEISDPNKVYVINSSREESVGNLDKKKYFSNSYMVARQDQIDSVHMARQQMFIPDLLNE